MDILIGDLFRWFGWGVLKLVTKGRYRSDDPAGLAEGVLGFAIFVGLAALVYRLVG
jgi:hypothetical protein